MGLRFSSWYKTVVGNNDGAIVMKIITAWNGSAYVPARDSVTGNVLVVDNELMSSALLSWNGGVDPAYDSSNVGSYTITKALPTSMSASFGDSNHGADIILRFYLQPMKWRLQITWKYEVNYTVVLQRLCTPPNCSPVGTYSFVSQTTPYSYHIPTTWAEVTL